MMMRPLLVALLLLVAAPALAQERTPGEVIRSAVDDVFRPGFAALSQTASGLAAEAAGLCADPTRERLEAIRARFADVVEAWSRVEHFRFGPLVADHRTERILFWPDRRGVGLRQVQALLAEQDETATDPATLMDKSVAVQGLVALEFVLFGTGADNVLAPEGDFRCRYGAAIAASIAGIAADVLVEWRAPGGIADRMTEPTGDDPAYRSEREVLEELVGTLSHGVEAIRDTRILPVLGREADDEPRPRAALFWRSGLTLRSLGANLDGLRQLFDGSGIADAVEDEGLARYLGEATRFEFGNADRALGLVEPSLEQALADPRKVQALRYLVIVTRSLQSLFGEQLSGALGLSVGFSSLDGD